MRRDLIKSSSFESYAQAGRIKHISVFNLSQLVSVLDLLLNSLGDHKTLLLIDDLMLLLGSQRSLDGSLSQPSVIMLFVQKLKELSESCLILTLCISSGKFQIIIF